MEELLLLLSVATILRGQGPLLKAENQLEIKIAGRDREHALASDWISPRVVPIGLYVRACLAIDFLIF